MHASTHPFQVLLLGPTNDTLDLWFQTLGEYINYVVPLTFRTDAYESKEWLGSWTVFYWSWWVSWAPFAGAFIARISKGRKIREMVLAVILVPCM